MIKKIIEVAKKLVVKFAPKVKEEIKEFAAEALEKVENIDYSDKLEALVDAVMKKVKLPLWLKPFKGVIKKIITDTIENLIEEGKEKLNSNSL